MDAAISAIILAGGSINDRDALFPVAGYSRKSMLPVLGKPMVQWVIQALEQAETISDIIVVGIEDLSWHQPAKSVTACADAGSMLANIKCGLDVVNQGGETQPYVLLASADIPAISGEIVDWRVRSALRSGADLDYAVVTRTTMERRFPHSNRSYLRLKDHELCGGDLNVVRTSLAGEDELWERIIRARKSALRQAALLGFDLFLGMLTHRISLDDAVQKVSVRLGLKGVATISPYAELAMDIDKPEHLRIIEGSMSARDHTV